MEHIDQIINKLGGCSKNPRCKIDSINFVEDLSTFKMTYNKELPNDYAEFYKQYGPCAFNKDVVVDLDGLMSFEEYEKLDRISLLNKD